MRRLLVGLLVVAVAAVGFAVLLGSGSASVASALAAQPDGSCGLCVLFGSGQALSLSGNGGVVLGSGNVLVGSSGRPAVVLSGNASLSAPSVGVVGSVSESGNASVANLSTGVAAVADPLDGLAVPQVAVPSSVPSVSVHGNESDTVAPGVYGNLSVSGNGGLTLSDGTYVLLGGFGVSGNGLVSAPGATIFLACAGYPAGCRPGEQGAGFRFSGNGSLDLGGPADGCPSVALESDPQNTSSIELSGNGRVLIDGVVYARSGLLSVSGNGSQVTLGGPVVVGRASLSGNGGVKIAGSLPLSVGLSLGLSASSLAPVVGGSESLSAVLECHGRPIAGVPVSFVVTGANPVSSTAKTDTTGTAVFSYPGGVVGADSAVASYVAPGVAISSSPLSVGWVKAQPVVSSALSASTVTIGGSVSDTAQVSGGFHPGGSVSFDVYAASDSSCLKPLNSQPLTGSLGGGAASSPRFAPPAPGVYQFVAVYGGDGDNEPASTACGDPSEQVTVQKARPSIGAALSAQTVTIGGSVVDAATVSGGYQPGGSVSFNVYAASDTSCGTPVNTQPLTASLVAGSAASPLFTPSAPGTYELVATYGGDQSNNGVSTACGDPAGRFTVALASPSIAGGVSASQIVLGASITDSASVSGGYAATGAVSFNVYAASDTSCQTPLNRQPLSAPLGSPGSTTSPPYTPASIGTFVFVATYSGDSDNQRVATGCDDQAQRVAVISAYQGAKLTLAPATGGPDMVGASQSLAATFTDASGDPLVGRTITLEISGANLGSQTAQTDQAGVASFSYSGVNAGRDTVSASFSEPGGITVASNSATVTWSSKPDQVMPIATTPVRGDFYARAPGDGSSSDVFSAKPGDTPAFIQTFPDINFNPVVDTGDRTKIEAPGVAPWFVNGETRPFTDVTTDALGNPDGVIVAQGNGVQAAVGSLREFNAAFTARFTVAQAGDVTFRVRSEDGFMLGVGGGASSFSNVVANSPFPGDPPATSSFVNAPASGDSVFDGLPLVAAFNHDQTGSETHLVTVHFPAAGSYPYELDYFHDVDDSYAPFVTLTMSVASFTPDDGQPLSVYVGYADGCYSACHFDDGFPSPWEFSPSVTNFIGNEGTFGFDAGAVMLHNNTAATINVDDVSVDVASAHFDLWGSPVRVDPGSDTILTQTVGGATPSDDGNFDTSDVPPAPTCTNDGVIPQIHVTLGGKTTTYLDNSQVLVTGGLEGAFCFNKTEAQPWSQLGAGQVAINRPLPPSATLTLSPSEVSGDKVGQTQTLTVKALDATGSPLANQPVTIRVAGPNQTALTATTNAQGVAQTSYTGGNPGLDVISASIPIGGETQYSNQLQLTWAIPAAAPPPPSPNSSGAQPPAIQITSPSAQSNTTGPTPVVAQITAAAGDSISSWSATLTPAGQNAMILAQGSGTPPSTLATIEPAKLGGGTYDLTIHAVSGGGSADGSERITIGTVPGIPPPAPVVGYGSTAPPQINQISPANQSVVAAPTNVSINTTPPPAGTTVYPTDVSLTPIDGGQTSYLPRQDVTGTVATIDPSQFAPGTYTMTVATNATTGSEQKSETITIGTGSSNTTVEPPSIGPVSPSNGTVVHTAVPIGAQVSAPGGQSITTWSVSEQGSKASSATTIASGSGTPPSNLATFDPGSLPNDTYTITVQATASGGGVASATTTLLVSGNLKLGRFLQTYQDLDVPVTGFDMKVTRIYDSTDKTVGDFGIGWHLALSGFTIATNGPLGNGGWSASPSDCTFTICGYAYTSSRPHTVTVTWPDKHQEVFDMQASGPQLDDIDVTPSFVAQPGTNTTSTLTVDGETSITNGSDGNLYDDNFNPWTATRFDLTTRDGRTLVLDTSSGLVSETDRNGNSLTVGPDGITTNAGPALSFTRDSTGRITDITGPTGQHLHYSYSTAGDLGTYTDADGNVTTYTYDTDHDLLAAGPSGPARPIQQQIYDPGTGRLSEVIDGDGNVTKISQDTTGRTETVADPNGKLTTINTYDQLGDLTEQDKVIAGKTLKTTHTYDNNGRLLSTTDPLGHTTSTTYDTAGDPTTQTDADGNTTHYSYDSAGDLIGVIGPDGSQQLSITRDANGNATRVQRADGRAYSYTYDSAGHVMSVTDPSGRTETITYDANGNPATVTDNAGQVTKLTVDAAGHITRQVDPDGNSTSASYDANGNLARLTDGNGNTQTFTYDQYANQLTHTDPLGNTSSAVYDGAGRLTSSTDANGQTTSYSYDPDGQLTAASASDGTTSITYDGLERPVMVANPSQSLSYAYDDAGQIASVTSSAVGAAPQTTLSYGDDAAGNKTSLTGPDGTTRYGYDAFSRLTSVTPSGEPNNTPYTLSYDPIGRIATIARPDGITSTLSYSGNDLLSTTATVGGNTVAQSSYTYGPTGLRSTATDSAGTTTSYSYDPVGRLTQAAISGGLDQTYGYDPAGNRSGATYNAADQVTQDSTASYAYDADGQLIRKTITATGQTTTYDWNSRHQLTAVHLPDGTTETNTYDALGRRISTSHASNTTSYVYDGANIHLQYDSGTTGPAAIYTDGTGIDQVLAMARDGHRYAYITDGQNSTTTLADENGNIAQRYTYDPYGNQTTTGQSITNPFTYTGREYDPASGLYYYRARWYNPSTGTFLGRDPLIGLDPYPYADDDPINGMDPGGTQTLEDEDATLAVDASLSSYQLVEGASTNVDVLAASGREVDPVDAARLLTRAGRSLAKHSDLFPSIAGGPAALNEAGQEALEEILTDPSTVQAIMQGGNFVGGNVFVGPDGIGAVFGPDGTFQYFGRF